ncbi:MAG TPA: hypothetical protein VGL24_11565 [Chthoniobacterales bacterium]
MNFLPSHKFPRLPWRVGLLLAGAVFFCAQAAHADDAKSIKGFRDAIVALSPTVDPAEAQMVAEISHQTARRLAKEWRVVPPANFQNFLIHIGARQRGFCFDWAHGIGAKLRTLPLKTLEFHWAEAYPNTRLEHNVIVVTAPNQPIGTGYIIDGWRAAGRLLWWPVLKDEYPWKENPAETAWMQNRGPDPLRLHDEPPVQEAARGKSRDANARKSADAL